MTVNNCTACSVQYSNNLHACGFFLSARLGADYFHARLSDLLQDAGTRWEYFLAWLSVIVKLCIDSGYVCMILTFQPCPCSVVNSPDNL